MFRKLVVPALLLALHNLSGHAFAQSSAQPSAQNVKFCTLATGLVSCGYDLKDGAGIMAAMAAPETTKEFTEALYVAGVFADGDEREDYRRSLEANRRAIVKYEKKARKQMRQRKMTPDDFEAIREQYVAALQNYNLGMNLYREATWLSLVPPYQQD